MSDLISEGLVAETALLESQGGRRTSLLEPVGEGAYLLGADVGERGVTVGLFNLRMRLVDKEFRGGTDDETPDHIARDLSNAIAELERRNPSSWPKVAGIGLGLPGIVETDFEGRQTLYAESLGWPPVPVASLLDQGLPVRAENGAATQAKAEQWFGVARGSSTAVVAMLGRGVGLGVITNGELYCGASGSAAEWGHLSIDPQGPICRCGRRGCLEAFLGSQALLEEWKGRGGTLPSDERIAIRALFDTGDAGDSDANALIERATSLLGTALGGLVNLYNPQGVIVGGWVGTLFMERRRTEIESAMRVAALERPGSQTDLYVGSVGENSVTLGAAILPLEDLVCSRRPSNSIASAFVRRNLEGTPDRRTHGQGLGFAEPATR
ncbi:ROK family protein [Agromyces sp. Soil535]|uniref:ROK family protein n=1 Tax=Agromyces sp. Soil535 TaxID=1736390 RepID=UPI0035115383